MDETRKYTLAQRLATHNSDYLCYDAGREHHHYRYCCKHTFKIEYEPYDIREYCWQRTLNGENVSESDVTRYCCKHRKTHNVRSDLSDIVSGLTVEEMREVLQELVDNVTTRRF